MDTIDNDEQIFNGHPEPESDADNFNSSVSEDDAIGADAPEEMPKPTDAADVSNAADSGKNEFNAAFDSLNADTANFANQMFNVLISEGKSGNRESREKLRNFHRDDCKLVKFDEEEELNIYEFDEEFIAETQTTLLTKRILVLAGRPDLGKTVTALRLCQKVDEVPSMADKRQQTLIVKSLKTNIKLNLAEVAKDAKNFSYNTLVFGNAFASGNIDLSDFFANLDPRQLKDITASMEKNEMYFIFTTNTDLISSYEQNLRKMNILATHPLLEEDQLRLSFKRKLDSVSVIKNLAPEKIEDLLERESEEFDRLFKTRQILSVIEFVDTYLEFILDEKINVKEAIEELEHLDNWFLDELTKQTETEISKESIYLNFETWCFVLTLTLTQCVRKTTDNSSPYEAVPWIYFEQFREKITSVLMAKIGIFYPRKISFKNHISEQKWLASGRAEIYKDAEFGTDMIRFEKERYPEQLWEILLKKARRTLFMLIPALEELAEENNPGIRSLAARILGRIGEIDVDEITFRISRNWIHSSIKQMATVGYLYEGVLFSQNKSYRDVCQTLLENMHLDFTSDTGGKEKVQRGLWTAIATYKQIGKYKLSSAIKQLGKIAESALTGQAGLEKELAVVSSKISKDFEKSVKTYMPELTRAEFKSVGKIVDSQAKEAWESMRETLFFIYKNDPYFKVFKYTLISLCLSVSPLKVLTELHKWFDSDNEELKMFTAFSFLREGGIAEDLEKYKVQVSLPSNSGDGESIWINYVIDEMTASENSVKKMSGFLEDIFCSFDIPESTLVRSYYRQQFFQLLKKWAKESMKSVKHQEIMVHLFLVLLDSLIEELASGLNKLIRDDAEFLNVENPLYRFKQKIFEMSLSL